MHILDRKQPRPVGFKLFHESIERVLVNTLALFAGYRDRVSGHVVQLHNAVRFRVIKGQRARGARIYAHERGHSWQLTLVRREVLIPRNFHANESLVSTDLILQPRVVAASTMASGSGGKRAQPDRSRAAAINRTAATFIAFSFGATVPLGVWQRAP